MPSSTCTFTSPRGHELAARLERPAGPVRATAVFAHCFTCSKDLRSARLVASELRQRGLAVLSFDFTGLGASGGALADSSFSCDVDDLVAAADYVGDTIAPPAVLVGHSLGGAAVLAAAERIPSVTAVATIGAPAGGWMHTGDAGSIDADGFVYVSDRVKDMIISGGENIYPREIEDVLFQLPAVADAAVIGVPDEKWGETVKAVIQVKDGETLTEAGVRAHCRANLGGFKQPSSVDFIDVIPRNLSGKVLKKDLRAPYWEGHDRGVS